MTIISVFGSSRVPPDSADYTASYAVGQSLAQAGYTVMSGGYAGVMEAASKGAAEAGGHVIGVTTPQIEKVRPIPANQWVTEERRKPTMTERLHHLIYEAAGYIVMPGGVGTLNELVLAWEWMRIREISARPLICYGDMWEQTLTAFMDDRYLPAHHQVMVQFAASPQDAVTRLREQLENERETR